MENMPRAESLHDVQWLMRDVAFIAQRLYSPSDSDSPAFASRLQLSQLLVRTAAPHLAHSAARLLLCEALDAVLFSGSDAFPVTFSGAVLQLLASAHAAIWAPAAGQCSPAPVEVRSAHLWLRTERVPARQLPDTVRCGAVPVHLPDALRRSLAAHGPDFAVDIVTAAVSAPRPLIADIASLGFMNASSGAEIAVRGLPDPIVLAFPVRGRAVHAPVEDHYECVFEVCRAGRGRAADGGAQGARK